MTTEEILAFERQWWQAAGAKEAAINQRFGISGVRYAQLLTRCLDDPAALAIDPLTVRRLQRIRDARACARYQRGLING